MADGFRIAFCIECHKYTPVLQELCRQLQHPEADIFIHVDAKSDIGDFAPLRPLARFIHPRSKVYWGEYGQIDCMLKLLRATCNGDYRYIAILSGDTLPLRPCGQIHDFLEACYPRQFADMQPELHITELTQKMQWCHYPDRNDWIGRLPGYFRKRLYKRLRPGDNPYFRTLPPLEKGSNWIVVTDRFRDFVFDYLRTHPDYIRAFRHSHCGDEIFFQTLMGISEFAGANTRRPLVYTRWVGEGAPHPKHSAPTTCPGCCRHGTRRRKFRTSSPARSPTTWTSPATGRRSSDKPALFAADAGRNIPAPAYRTGFTSAPSSSFNAAPTLQPRGLQPSTLWPPHRGNTPRRHGERGEPPGRSFPSFDRIEFQAPVLANDPNRSRPLYPHVDEFHGIETVSQSRYRNDLRYIARAVLASGSEIPNGITGSVVLVCIVVLQPPYQLFRAVLLHSGCIVLPAKNIVRIEHFDQTDSLGIPALRLPELRELPAHAACAAIRPRIRLQAREVQEQEHDTQQ